MIGGEDKLKRIARLINAISCHSIHCECDCNTTYAQLWTTILEGEYKFFVEDECVVCMDDKSCMWNPQCGHIACCEKCSGKNCPVCQCVSESDCIKIEYPNHFASFILKFQDVTKTIFTPRQANPQSIAEYCKKEILRIAGYSFLSTDECSPRPPPHQRY